jgi:hypothetical protein
MKHGKKPTVAQKKLMVRWKLDPDVWLVVKDTPEKMELCHRMSEKTRRVIPKGGDRCRTEF